MLILTFHSLRLFDYHRYCVYQENVVYIYIYYVTCESSDINIDNKKK